MHILMKYQPGNKLFQKFHNVEVICISVWQFGHKQYKYLIIMNK